MSDNEELVQETTSMEQYDEELEQETTSPDRGDEDDGVEVVVQETTEMETEDGVVTVTKTVTTTRHEDDGSDSSSSRSDRDTTKAMLPAKKLSTSKFSKFQEEDSKPHAVARHSQA
ncbi:uncharacterized protein LOC100376509 isoform X2 [Saccoglossus kowalevskii]